ncbi:MAG: hypothetical protein IJN94_00970 [Clostridia bacterium]|nr:hypothetical protein [Clostridia bacterium]
MAEICLDCWNELTGKKYTKRKYILSENLYLCENCGQYKNVIIVERKYYYLNIIKSKLKK